MSLECFSIRLKEMMKSENLSKRAFAAKIGAQRKSLLNWLNGMYYPRYDALIKIADYFKVSIDFLVGRTRNTYQEYESLIPLDHVPETFRLKLNRYMAEMKITKYRLAKSLGVGQTTLSRWFTVGGMPEISILIKIASLMDESIDFLLGREAKKILLRYSNG